MIRILLVGLFLLASLILAKAESAPHAAPLIPDPPPAIDGTLKRFETVPGWLKLHEAEQVVFGKQEWRGPEDLSAQVLVSWDVNALYIAAKVVDQGMQQPYHAAHLWKGSHVMVLLELPRKEPAQRSKEEIIQIGLSPGDPSREGAKAEIFRWHPKLGEVAEAKVAAQMTPSGYQIEAAIPWTSLGIESAGEGMPVGIDVTVSSSDRPGEVMQNKIMSLLTLPWKLRDPDRLMDFLLADANGQVDPSLIPQPAHSLVNGITLPAGESTEISLPATPEKMKELILQARLEMPHVAGGTHVMRVFFDGTELDLTRSRNRGATVELGVKDINSYSRGAWYVLYGPDFTPPPADSLYHMRGVHPFEFRFDVSDLWQPGKAHQLRIEHTRPNAPALHLDAAVSRQLSTRRIPPTPAPAPTGEIPSYEPRPPAPAGTLGGRLLDGGAIEATNGTSRWIIESAFSTTEPGWARFQGDAANGWEAAVSSEQALHYSAHTRDYTVERRIEQRNDHIVVKDTLINRSDTDVPILIHHRAMIAAAERTAVYLCGRSFQASEMATEEGENPTSLALVKEGGLGLVSEDDIMRVQSDNFYDESAFGIRNHRFVLAKGKTVTLEFSIYPLEGNDPFLFVNRVRRNWGVNQTIPGGFSFVGAHRKTKTLGDLSDDALAQYLEDKNANIVGVALTYHEQLATHGNRFNEFSWQPLRDYITILRKLRPEARIIPYYHCFISNGQGDADTFRHEAIVAGDGRQVNYGNRGIYPLFTPVEGTPYALMQEDLIEKRFDLGVDGIYWDEIEYSQAKYQFSPDWWDGVTGDIDLRTHRLRRKISSVTLLSLPWREKMARSIMKRGLLVGNSQAITRTFTRLHFPRFIETGSISNLIKGQLGTPIALGDHLAERNERDCYRNMVKGLDYGALYYWYSPRIIPTRPTLTHYMFPMTPLEMGVGFLIGEERILTNTSGYFGWGDASDFTAHVFDASGYETAAVAVPAMERNGKNYAEVRIPEGYSVALVRKKR